MNEKARHLGLVGQNLQRAGSTLLKDPVKHLHHAARMLESLSFKKVLERGYAVVRGADGRLVSTAQEAGKEPVLTIEFKENGQLQVRKS